MKASKLLTILAWLVGEAIILFSFYQWGGGMERDIRILNAGVSAWLFFLLFVDTLIPWINLRGKSGADVSSLGGRMLFLTLYIVAAVAAIIVCNTVLPCVFLVQALIQGILLFLFIIGLIIILSIGERTASVHQEEQSVRQQLVNLRQVADQLKLALGASTGIAPQQAARLQALADNIRYISPSQQAEAHALEADFAAVVRELIVILGNPTAYANVLDSKIAQAELLYQQRKMLYFN